jgi:hypothetical protein
VEFLGYLKVYELVQMALHLDLIYSWKYSIFSVQCFSKEIEYLQSIFTMHYTYILFRSVTKKTIITAFISFYKKKSCIKLELDSTLQARKEFARTCWIYTTNTNRLVYSQFGGRRDDLPSLLYFSSNNVLSWFKYECNIYCSIC